MVSVKGEKKVNCVNDGACRHSRLSECLNTTLSSSQRSRRRWLRHILLYLGIRIVAYILYKRWLQTSSMNGELDTLSSSKGDRWLSNLKLPLILRRDSSENVRENLFKFSLASERPETFLHRSTYGLSKIQQSQVPYISNLGVLPPLLLYFLSTMFHALGSVDLVIFLVTLLSDGIAAFLLARTVNGLTYDAVRGRPDLATIVDIVSIEEKDDSLPLICTTKDTSIKNSTLYHVSRVNQSNMLTPESIMAVYLLNPVTITASIMLSLHSLRASFLLAALSFSLVPFYNRRYSFFLGPAALASFLYITPIPTGLALGVVLGHAFGVASKWQCNPRNMSPLGYELFKPVVKTKATLVSAVGPILEFLALTICFFAMLHVLSFLFCHGSWSYWQMSVTNFWAVKDLSPNLGIFWYMAQLTVLNYKLLFVTVYQVAGLAIGIPLLLKCQRIPLTAAQFMTGALLLFQPYVAASDIVTLVCVLLLDYPIFQRTKVFSFWILAAFVTGSLFVARTSIWMHKSTENPNISFIIQLAFFVSTCAILLHYVRRALIYRLAQHQCTEEAT